MTDRENPTTRAHAPRWRLLVGAALLLALVFPVLWVVFLWGRPWTTPAHGPLVREVLALPVPGAAGDLHAFSVDGTVAPYVPVGTEVDRAARLLAEQGFAVRTDTVTYGGFVAQRCAACTSEVVGWFQQGRLQGDQVIWVRLGIEGGRVRVVGGQRHDRAPAILL